MARAAYILEQASEIMVDPAVLEFSNVQAALEALKQAIEDIELTPGPEGPPGPQGPPGANGSDASATTNASELTSGTLPDARLSSNIPRKGSANTFSQVQSVPALQTKVQNLGNVSGSVSINPDAGEIVVLTATGNVEATINSGPSDCGRRLVIRFVQNAAGSWTLTWGGGNVQSPWGITPPPTPSGLSASEYELKWNGESWVIHNFIGGLE